MDMVSASEIAKKWGVTPRYVQMACKSGKIAGAKKLGNTWMLPSNVTKDFLMKASDLSVDMPLPRKTPFLFMSDLYSEAGKADECAETLSYNHEAQVLFKAEIAYSRGDIDTVYERANYLLNKHSGFYAVLSAGMLLALCAIWRGDIFMWNKAKTHICEAPAKNDNDRDIMSLAITAIDSMLYNTNSFPDWFKIGNFEPLHPDALPAAKVYYAKYLYAEGYSLATKEIQIEGMQGLSLMSVLPIAIEPMISQAMADKSIIAEIYLRFICATVYHTSGNTEQAIRHLDRAIDLALPDKLYGLIAEYRRVLDNLLEDRLALKDKDALKIVNQLYATYNVNWAKLSGMVRNRYIATTLTAREKEIAKLAAFGLTNQEIAEKLNVSLASVKQAIRSITSKGGIDARNEIASIL